MNQQSNTPWECWLATLVGVLILVAIWDAAEAAELRLQPDGGSLQAAVDAAAPGDTLILAPGVYAVNLKIQKPITLRGEPGAVLDGSGHGDVIRIDSPDVELIGLTLRNSGCNLTDMNAAIFVERSASNVHTRDNRIESCAFGIWLDASPGAWVLNNRISGDPTIRSQDRGNGIHLYAVSGARVEGNEVWHTRDGIYIDTSNHNALLNNELHDLRYGIHYMYSYYNEVLDNRTHETRTGFALMQSKFLTVTGNRSERDGNYGILMNFITNSTIADNVVVDVQRGRSPGFAGSRGILGAEGKAIFVYNSQFNQIRDNRFEGAEIGIHLTAGSEGNDVHGNAFIANVTQVKYVANRAQEWSHAGRGNYWSDYLGWDLNADGFGDLPYEPNDAVDKLLWKYPMAKVLMNSPVVQTLRWVQRQFPVLRPQGVKDSFPLMVVPQPG